MTESNRGSGWGGVLRLDAVSKRYGRGRWVLRDVGLEVPAGDVLAITGANGSGKSTLLRVVVGLSTPTSGTLHGRPDVVGYVPDRFPPNERLSGIAYLTHLGRIRGLRTDVAARRAEELLERLALVGGGRAPVRTLSKGNAQKVAVAQALLVPPELFVLDEPWSGLDASAHGVLGEIIGEVAGAGGAVIFTDQRESIIGAHATRAYAVRDGRVDPRPVDTAPPARTAVVEVVLRLPRDGRSPLDASDLRAMAGVLDAVPDADRVTVRVAERESDALLLAALGAGWSVWSVRRDVVADEGGVP